MSARKLFVITCVVLVLLGLAVFKKTAEKAGEAAARKAEQSSLEVVTENIPEAFVSRMLIYKGFDETDRIDLRKDAGGAWSVEDHFGVRAQAQAVKGLLDRLSNLRGELRANSKGVFEDFQIQDSEALHIVVEAEGGKVILHLLVSFLKADWDTNFVRLYDSDKVVHVHSNIMFSLGLFGKEMKLDYKQFAFMGLAEFDSADVERMTIVGAGQMIVLKRAKPVDDASSAAWEMTPPPAEDEEVDTTKVEEMMRAVRGINGFEVVDPSLDIYGLNNPQIRILLNDSMGANPIQVEIGNYIEPEKAYYARALPSKSVFKVSDAYIQNIRRDGKFFLKPKEVKKEELPGPKPS